MKRLLAMLSIVAACKSPPPPARDCLPYSADLMPRLTDGLIRKDFRIANAWAVRSDKPMDTVPAYFVSADIIAPNGEAVIGTWLTDKITVPGRIYSVSPQATKYTNWGGTGDRLTAGVTVETGGVKESRECVLKNRSKAVTPTPAAVSP